MNKKQQNQIIFITLGVVALYSLYLWGFSTVEVDPTKLTAKDLREIKKRSRRVGSIEELRSIKDPATRLLKARRFLEDQKFNMDEARAKLQGGFKGSRQDYEDANEAIDRQADEVKQIIKELERVVSVVITP